MVMREWSVTDWSVKGPQKIKVGHNIETNCRGFADVLALLVKDLNDAITQISVLQSITEKIGLKISLKKQEE